ncbi:MAG: FMN-binding negative transcriptional regulator, partial [Pseudomonadota bacterium]
ISHVPFLLSDDGQSADLHLVRSNPIVRTISAPTSAVIAISGPDGYVSPDWYGIEDQVPTWNYVAVHLRGTLNRLPTEDMHDMLDRQSAAYEDRLLPKPPWRTGKMDQEALRKMLRMIVPFRMEIQSVDGTWKLNQNKPDDVRMRAADAIESGGIGSELSALVAMMRDA